MALRTTRPAKTHMAALAAAIGAGLAVGLGTFTFGYARGASYLTNDPAACANCHVMTEHFQAWSKSSHHAVAVCNDCHAPHDLIGKYATKARNGFWHSFFFTTGRYPDPLRITLRNRDVTEGTCRFCHADIVDQIDAPAAAHGGARGADAATSCIRCHAYVGHLVR